jgi:hypothetical protein
VLTVVVGITDPDDYAGLASRGFSTMEGLCGPQLDLSERQRTVDGPSASFCYGNTPHRWRTAVWCRRS